MVVIRGRSDSWVPRWFGEASTVKRPFLTSVFLAVLLVVRSSPGAAVSDSLVLVQDGQAKATIVLAAQPGTVDDGSEAVDLDQTPGEVVFLTAADSEIAALSAAQHWRLSEDPSTPSLRLVNLMQLGHSSIQESTDFIQMLIQMLTILVGHKQQKDELENFLEGLP